MEISMKKKIEGFDGYLIDNFGNVYSLNYGGLGYVRQLKQQRDKDGYSIVCLCNGNKPCFKKVHRLVAEAFIPNPEKKSQVNHKNGKRDDNRLENLEWCTPLENNLHSYRVLHKKSPTLGKFGKDNSLSKMVLQIKDGKVIAEFYGINEASRIARVYSSNICNCCKGKIKTAGGYVWKYKDC